MPITSPYCWNGHTTLPPVSAVFTKAHRLPFLATDRNVLNLPAIGKSMTFKMVGITPEGKRILRFEHDGTRRHSPIIDSIGAVYIVEKQIHSRLSATTASHGRRHGRLCFHLELYGRKNRTPVQLVRISGFPFPDYGKK